MNVLVGALKVRVRRQGAQCVFQILARHSRDEKPIGSLKPYLSVFFSWCTGVSSLAGRYMHSRAPSLGQAMREGKEEEVSSVSRSVCAKRC